MRSLKLALLSNPLLGRNAPVGTLGAGEGTRTLDIKLGKLALYQLSYARVAVGDMLIPRSDVNLTSKT